VLAVGESSAHDVCNARPMWQFTANTIHQKITNFGRGIIDAFTAEAHGSTQEHCIQYDHIYQQLQNI
jgi:hypothetical protein